MSLSRFITEQMEAILTEWDAFARTLGQVGAGMTDTELRDHARQILQAAATDIDSSQSVEESSQKAKGKAPDDTHSAASEHGTLRQASGFTMIQMVGEYRALRATVLRLWMKQVKEVTEDTTSDMLRFNEAIDQAVAESTARFTEQAGQTRDTFLAILGHDLRTPLAAMAMAGDLLTMKHVDTLQAGEIGSRVKRSAAAMKAMVDDLLEYARTQLGTGMPINRRPTDVREVCQGAIDEASMAFPECHFELIASGDLTGSFDAARLRQALTNLLSNAVQYRSQRHPVRIEASAEADRISIRVHNHGPVIPAESLKAIFNPLVQLTGDGQEENRPSTSLGLGLFIAREVSQAHGGSISAESDENSGTVFTVLLPRTPPP